jgi:hypothetical protein
LEGLNNTTNVLRIVDVLSENLAGLKLSTANEHYCLTHFASAVAADDDDDDGDDANNNRV